MGLNVGSQGCCEAVPAAEQLPKAHCGSQDAVVMEDASLSDPDGQGSGQWEMRLTLGTG